MFYFEETDTNIIKYQVQINKEELLKLKVLIIENCSEIFERTIKSTLPPQSFIDPQRYKNVKYHKIGTKDGKDGPDLLLYEYSFYEYVYPYLIELIDKLLKGDFSIIPQIKNYTIEPKESFETQIESCSRELNNIDNLDISKKRQKLEELEKLVKHAKLNKNQELIYKYLPSVNSNITLIYIDTMPISIIKRVNEFYGQEKTNDKSKTYRLNI